MATLTVPTDTILIDTDTNTFFTNLKTNVDAMYGSAPVTVTDAATYTVLAADAGKLHIVPDLTADCTLTLPANSAGAKFEFWYGGAAADAQDWIFNVTDGAVKGGLVHLDADANSAADEVVPVYSDGTDTIVTVLTPEVGTKVTFVSDGTNYWVNGYVASATVPTIA